MLSADGCTDDKIPFDLAESEYRGHIWHLFLLIEKLWLKQWNFLIDIDFQRQLYAMKSLWPDLSQTSPCLHREVEAAYQLLHSTTKKAAQWGIFWGGRRSPGSADVFIPEVGKRIRKLFVFALKTREWLVSVCLQCVRRLPAFECLQHNRARLKGVRSPGFGKFGFIAFAFYFFLALSAAFT